MRAHKVRLFRSPYGTRYPLVPRRIGMALKIDGGRGRYPTMHYKWPSRVFVSLFTDASQAPGPSSPGRSDSGTIYDRGGRSVYAGRGR
jgi:hypothetical protein